MLSLHARHGNDPLKNPPPTYAPSCWADDSLWLWTNFECDAPLPPSPSPLPPALLSPPSPPSPPPQPGSVVASIAELRAALNDPSIPHIVIEPGHYTFLDRMDGCGPVGFGDYIDGREADPPLDWGRNDNVVLWNRSGHAALCITRGVVLSARVPGSVVLDAAASATDYPANCRGVMQISLRPSGRKWRVVPREQVRSSYCA